MPKSEKHITVVKRGGPRAFAFLLTYIGALIYFLDKANGFWEGVLAFLQAAVWPALLINKIFTILNI